MSNKIALITGGTGALGQAVVKHFLENGHTVVVPWIIKTEVDALTEITKGLSDNLQFIQCDVTKHEEVTSLFETIEHKYSRLDILANIVGGFAFASLEETTIEIWDKMFNMNASSCFLCSRAACLMMQQNKFGRIINVAAQPAFNKGAANMSAYSASKAAVLNFTYSLADEFSSHGITANAIIPTIIDTPANHAAMPDADKSTWLAPTDIAKVISFLASDDANIVTGTAVNLGQA